MTRGTMPPVTFRGDVIVRDRGAYFHVWRIASDGLIDPKPDVQPFATNRRHIALEKALDMVRGTDGRVFMIDRNGVWTLVRRPGASEWSG